VAPDLESGLSCAESTQFNAILVEFNLRSERSLHPRTGKGLQPVRQLRALEVSAPVLMFTAMEGELYERGSLDAGVDDFFAKTTSIPSLISRLRAHIPHPQVPTEFGWEGGLKESLNLTALNPELFE